MKHKKKEAFGATRGICWRPQKWKIIVKKYARLPEISYGHDSWKSTQIPYDPFLSLSPPFSTFPLEDVIAPLSGQTIPTGMRERKRIKHNTRDRRRAQRNPRVIFLLFCRKKKIYFIWVSFVFGGGDARGPALSLSGRFDRNNSRGGGGKNNNNNSRSVHNGLGNWADNDHRQLLNRITCKWILRFLWMEPVAERWFHI